MAIYHFSAKVISRANGSSALAAAAYRSASRLHDERLDRHHDFSNKAGVVHSEVMLPDGAPEHLGDRQTLWNAVEAAEVRKDAQLAREVEFAIPRELDRQEGVRLAREFVERKFVSRGMIADLNVHWDRGADGEPKPHAHVMLTMREVGEDGFGAKVRDWNRTELLDHWRAAWAEHVNTRLAELDIDARVDHRSLEAQGIDLEPQHKIGPAASRMAEQGHESERLVEHHAIARANGAKIIADPTIALNAITHQQATFTTHDLARFVHRHSEGKDQFDEVMAAVRGSPELVALGKDGRGEQRFTSREMIETERRLERATINLDARRHHGLPAETIDRAIASAGSDGIALGGDQDAVVRRILSGADLATVIGYAGTGKSAMLGIARDGWERAGYHVQGAALSGIAAEGLEAGSGIHSRTLASLEHQWAQDRELLTDRSILVIDEAGMIGTRQMERVIGEAEKRQAKVVLVGDPEQLQAIEAGAAFRSIAERHGAYELTNVRRQNIDWQRDATRWLATERTGQALAAYAEHGSIHATETREVARADLVDRWDRDRQASPDASRIILTHTNDEVRALNEAARGRLRVANLLGDDVGLTVERGERSFARGDRVMFLRNERGLGVRNGTLGIVEQVSETRMQVRTDDGRSVAFDLKDYRDLDHGYAATIHKAQGMTVDRVHVLATPGLDRHATYVALSRHRDGVELHYGRDDFADRTQLVHTLSRERGKDMAADYDTTVSRIAGRNGYDRSAILDTLATERLIEPEHTAPVQRGMFDGLKISAREPTGRGMFDGLKLPTGSLAPSPEPDLGGAVKRLARAAADIVRMRSDGYRALPHQALAYDKARQALDALRPDATRDLEAAFRRDPALIGEATTGQTARAIRQMQLEAEIRTNPAMRADRFVEDWQTLRQRQRTLGGAGNSAAANKVRDQLDLMAKSLHRDPQLESLLENRKRALGITIATGGSVSQELQDSLGLSRGRGLGR